MKAKQIVQLKVVLRKWSRSSSCTEQNFQFIGFTKLKYTWQHDSEKNYNSAPSDCKIGEHIPPYIVCHSNFLQVVTKVNILNNALQHLIWNCFFFHTGIRLLAYATNVATVTGEQQFLIYKDILLPIWSYVTEHWGSTINSAVQILEKFQSKVLRQNRTTFT